MSTNYQIQDDYRHKSSISSNSGEDNRDYSRSAQRHGKKRSGFDANSYTRSSFQRDGEPGSNRDRDYRANRNDSRSSGGEGWSAHRGPMQIVGGELEEAEETDPVRIAWRQKQIDTGKNTIGYERYSAAVPREHRDPRKSLGRHPVTPPLRAAMPKRKWEGLCKQWRGLLHGWDEGTGFPTLRAMKEVRGAHVTKSVSAEGVEQHALEEDIESVTPTTSPASAEAQYSLSWTTTEQEDVTSAPIHAQNMIESASNVPRSGSATSRYEPVYATEAGDTVEADKASADEEEEFCDYDEAEAEAFRLAMEAMHNA